MKNDCYVNPLFFADSRMQAGGGHVGQLQCPEKQHGHSPSYRRVRSCATGKQGFTMVEMLVVVAIIGLIASATAGLYMGTFKNMQLEKSAKEIYLAAKYARLAAVEKQIECRLVIDKAEGRFFVYYKETDQESKEEKEVIVSNPYTKPVTLPEGVTIEDVMIVRSAQLNASESISDKDEDDSGNIVVFTASGTADCAVIKIGNGKTSYTVTVSPATGRVKIGRGEKEMPLDIIDLDELERGNNLV